VFATVSTFTK